jgi:hypothetical protein
MGALSQSILANCFPGAVQHEAKRSDAPQTRDRNGHRAQSDPGSAVHRHSASKTRVNALMALHRIRETPSYF